LLPVDADIATSTYIVVSAGDVPSATARLYDDDKSVSIEPTDLFDYAGVNGKYSSGTKYVELRYDAPVLKSGIILVDTPGIGGLESGHSELARVIARTADCVLFVVDASAPLNSRELSELLSISSHVDCLDFVMTRTDIHPDWRAVLNEDRRLLHEYAPRLANRKFFPVASPLVFEDNPTLPKRDRDTLRRESGIDAVGSYLVQHVARQRRLLRRANTLRRVTSTLDEIDVQVRQELAICRDPRSTQGQEQVEEALRRLQALASESAAWRSDLQTNFQVLGVDAHARLARELDALESQHLNDPEIPVEDLEPRIAAVWADLMLSLRERAKTIAAEASTSSVDAALADLSTVPLLLRTSIADERRDNSSADGEQQNLGARLNDLWPVVGAAMTTKLLFASVLGPISPLVLLGVGLAVGRKIGKHRQAQAEAQRATRKHYEIIRGTFAATRRELGAQLQGVIVEMRARLERALTDEIGTRRRSLEVTLTKTRALAQQTAEELEQRRARLTQLAERSYVVRAQIAHQGDSLRREFELQMGR
jgi:hypothetical protein